jgi:CheY-like chemotaxis protein
MACKLPLFIGIREAGYTLTAVRVLTSSVRQLVQNLHPASVFRIFRAMTAMEITKQRVLCVDDDATTCEVMGFILRDCEVISARTKAEALNKVIAEQFDLIILDYHLPDGTGVEVCSFIRAFDNRTPICFCTTTSSLSEEQAIAVGAQGIIKKDWSSWKPC